MTTPKYVRPTVAGWLTPTLLAPWITVYGAISAYVLLGLDIGRIGKAFAWGTGMLVGTAWAFVFCTLLVVVDVLMLAVKVRTLPAGRRGWLGALLAPLPVFGLYSSFSWRTIGLSGPWSIACAILVPMVLVAFAMRLFAGQKPLR